MFVVVSRQGVLDSNFSTVVCAPVFTHGHGLSTQVPVGVEEGLKHESAVFCDNLVSIAKAALTDYVGVLRPDRLDALDRALRVALGL